ncbi:MAG: DUF3443 family protein [Nitrospirae bacterium]|nr:MAG: DUF3443 family protein [Nitrospirota bacterium]
MILRGGSAVLFGVALAVLLGCGNSGSSGPSSPSGPSGPNVLAITIDPSSAAVCTFANEPCTHVTICQPGTSHCQTIADVLVDTGSSGLRIFASAVTITLPAIHLGECMYFGGATDWGRVHTVDVVLGGEPAVLVPIQVIGPTFAVQYTSAGQPASNICGVAVVDSSPVQAGFNGILGIGLFPFDGGVYYNCAALPCTAVAVSASQQVQNPVGLLPVDNNGVLVALPSVPTSGSPSLSGSLILGIGTASNNQPSGVTVLPTNSLGQIVTRFHPSSGVSTQNVGIFDSGSSAMFFSESSLSIPLCPSNSPNFPDLSFLYCPASPLHFSAVNTELSGSPSSLVSFQIADPRPLLQSGNAAISNMGGPTFSTGVFDWGLPFFFGRTVYVGLSGQTSVLGTGPFWAY